MEISGGGVQSQVEGCDRQWRGAIIGGGEPLGDHRWRTASAMIDFSLLQ